MMLRLLTCCTALALAVAAASCSRTAPPAEPAASGSERPPQRPMSYDQLVAAAQSYVDTGSAERAEEVARDAIAEDTKRPEAYVVFARAALLRDDLPAAAQRYEEARARGSVDRRTFVELASVYDVSQRYNEAVAVYEAYLAEHPDDVEMHQELGLTLVLHESFDAGIAHLERALELASSNVQIQTDLGFALYRAGRLDDAARNLEAVLAKSPDDPVALQFLAEVRAGQGRTQDALDLLGRAIRAGRTDPRPVRLRAQLRSLTGDHAGAIADWQALVKADPQDAGALIGAAGSMIALDRLGDAEEAVNRARKLVGDQPPVQFRAAQIGWRRGEAGALAQIQTYAEAHPTTLEAWRELQSAATSAGDRALAKRAAARVAELNESR